jgi:hypothetical protein
MRRLGGGDQDDALKRFNARGGFGATQVREMDGVKAAADAESFHPE